MIDLHVHSTRSDGTLSPTELVDYAVEKNLTAFALTDHDTIDGLEEAIAYAEKLRALSAQSSDNNYCDKIIPEVIPGIEFSTEYQGQDIHIVGLYIDYKNPAFAKSLQEFVASRHLRNKKMCRLLQEHGIDINYEELCAEFPHAVITRAHYAHYLLNHGFVSSRNEAFDRYIGDRAPCYIPREKVSPAQAVEMILAADGIPVLAHPMLYHMSDARLEALVAELKEAGLMGIEAIYNNHTLGDERQIRRLAAKYHLLISGGSDFHGENKPKLDLGIGYGSLHVPDSVLKDINASRKNLLFTDMDGTLLLSNSTISAAMKDGLNRMSAAGHHLILSSGRPLPSILEVRQNEGIAYPNMLIISYNGALIYDCDRRQAILEHRISQETVKAIVSIAEADGIHIQGYDNDEIVCHGLNDELRFYTRRIHLPLKCVEDIAAALPNGSHKLQTIHLTDKSALEGFREKLLQSPHIRNKIQIIFSNDKYLEILPKEAGKGNALRFITDFLPVPRSHTFAAGDAENDISMLEAAHVGIAMANGDAQVKACADMVTARSNDEDGLLEILDKYFT